MTITEIRNILESPYDRKVWKDFLKTQFTNNKLNAEDRSVSQLIIPPKAKKIKKHIKYLFEIFRAYSESLRYFAQLTAEPVAPSC